MMKKILPILTVALLLGACKGGVEEQVVSTYPDGTPELVYLLKGKDKKYVGELRYFSNGQKQSEIHYADDGTTPTGIWNYFYPQGERFAQWEVKAAEWRFECPLLREDGLSGLAVERLSVNNLPLEVTGQKGDTTMLFQFYEDFSLQCRGTLMGGVKHGPWRYYYPQGSLQTEATFEGGREEGPYRSFRENGIPYFIGQYTDGKRSGLWEFYDEKGDLSGTLNQDK